MLSKTLPLCHRCVCLPQKKRYAGFEPATSRSQGTEPSTKLSHCATMAYASHIKNDMLDSNLRPLVHKAQNLPPSSTKTLPLCHRCVCLPQKKRYAGFEPATSRSQGTEPSTKLSHCATMAYASHIKNDMLDSNLRPLVHKAQNLPPSSTKTLPLRHRCVCLPQKKRYAGFEPATSRSQGTEPSTKLSHCATMAYASHIKNDMLDSNLRPLVHKAQNLPPSSTKTLPLRHRCVCLPQKKRYAGFEPATSRSQGTEPSTKLSHCATMAYASHIKNDMLDSNLRPLVHKAQNLPPSSTKTLPLRHRCVCLPHKKRYAGFEPATSRSQGTEPSTKLSHCATMAYASHIKNDMLDSNLRPLVHKAQNLPPSSTKTLPLRHRCVCLPHKKRYAGFEPATSRSQGTEPSTKLSKNITTTPPLRRPPTKNTVCWIRTCDLSFTRYRTFHQALLLRHHGVCLRQERQYHYANVIILLLYVIGLIYRQSAYIIGNIYMPIL